MLTEKAPLSLALQTEVLQSSDMSRRMSRKKDNTGLMIGKGGKGHQQKQWVHDVVERTDLDSLTWLGTNS